MPQTTLTIPRETAEVVKSLARQEKRSHSNMVTALVENWRRTHCPECGTELAPVRCGCKAGERL